MGSFHFRREGDDPVSHVWLWFHNVTQRWDPSIFTNGKERVWLPSVIRWSITVGTIDHGWHTRPRWWPILINDSYSNYVIQSLETSRFQKEKYVSPLLCEYLAKPQPNNEDCCLYFFPKWRRAESGLMLSHQDHSLAILTNYLEIWI